MVDVFGLIFYGFVTLCYLGYFWVLGTEEANEVRKEKDAWFDDFMSKPLVRYRGSFMSDTKRWWSIKTGLPYVPPPAWEDRMATARTHLAERRRVASLVH